MASDTEILSDVLSRQVDLSAGECLSKSWDLFKRYFSQIFVAALLVNVASWSVGAVPYFGIFLSSAFHGVLYGGLFVFYLKLIRGQKAEIADAFSGFSPAFPQLLLVGGVTGLLTCAVVVLLALPFLLAVVPSIIFMANHTDGAWPVFPGALAVAAVLVAMMAGFFLTSLWIFAVPLVIDRKLEFWPAMELSRKVVLQRFWNVAALLLAAAVVALVGIFGCGIGILFTVPIAFGAVVYGYETIFGSPKAAA